MGKKVIGISIFFLGLVLLAGFVYFLFFSPNTFMDELSKFTGGTKTVAETPAVPAGEAVAETPVAVKRITAEEKPINDLTGQNIDVKPAVETAKDNVARMAASFAERFGSFSNQSNFSNIIDLKIFMSSRMQAWADEYVRAQRHKMASNDIYFGITTKAIAQEVKHYDDHVGQAEVLVNTRRREAVNSIANVSNVFNQNIVITFIKEKGAWKVDTASWQDKLN
ncbi:MAG: hypothetical protein MUC28_02845 [Planctomycetes bacterium]|jgi:hypothetical protein|nr:hypothetical protein [Planctomycetota bacterium]